MQNRMPLFRVVISAAASTVFFLLSVLPAGVAAQDRPGDPMAGGLIAGDYLLIAGGGTFPVNAQGSLRNYRAGPVVSLEYENWQPSGGGVGAVGFGLGVAYSVLPTKSGFADAVAIASGGTAGNASASSAKILEISSNLRIRIPSPVLMPAVTLGVGYINWAPGPVTYRATDGTNTKVKYQHRSGAELSIGGSIDRHVYDRYGLFAEAAYTYGFTSFGQAFSVPTANCANTACDPLKNTSVGTVRGGLRVGLGR
jgi:hypothetical protein